MKKVLALIMTILLAVSFGTVSLAQSEFSENFSIRNGIHYGMTKDEASKIEKSPLATVSDGEIKDADTLAFRGGHSKDKWNDYLYYKEITLAGYKNTYMSFGFDENGIIKDITYILNSGDQQKAYTDMRSNLSSKYDTPVFDENAPFPSESYRIASKDDKVLGVSMEFSVAKYSGWLVKYADCYVEIDLCLHKLKYNTNTNYICSIGYRLVSFEEFDELKELTHEEDYFTTNCLNSPFRSGSFARRLFIHV